MFCANCGKELKENANFCTSCGYKNNNQNENKENSEIKKVVITRESGSRTFEKIAMKIWYDGKIIEEINVGETVELYFPVGEHKVIFDSTANIMEYYINIKPENNTIYINVATVIGFFHSMGRIAIKSVRNE